MSKIDRDRILNYLFPLIVFTVGCIYFCRAYGEEPLFKPNWELECKLHQPDHDKKRALNNEDRRYCETKMQMHLDEGKRFYEQAKDKCWYLPDISNRQASREAFTTTVAMIGSPTPSGKLATLVLSTLVQYGLDCIDEWFYISDKLNWSKYHFDQADWYKEILGK